MFGDGQVITLAIVNKTPRAKGPGLVLQERGKGATASLLLAVAEANTRRAAQACEDIASVLQSTKRAGEASVTATLTANINQAHRALLEANGEAGAREPIAAGVCCAVVRGAQATLAQAGPGLAYWLDGERLVSSAPDLSPSGPKTNALGVARNLHVHLNRYTLKPGDTLLLSTSQLAQRAPERALEMILAEDLSTAAQRLYRLVRDLPNFSAILYRHALSEAA